MRQTALPTQEPSQLSGPTESSSEQARRWIETPTEFWEHCAQNYGPATALDLGSLGTVILISDPAAVKEVFRLTPDSFECRQYNEHYRYVIGDNSVLLQDGERHQQQRRLLAPMLLHDTVELIPVIREFVLRCISEWPQDQAFNPRPSLHDVASKVILRLLLGSLESEAGQALLLAYRRSVVEQMGSWGPWRSFARLQDRIRGVLAGDIRARRANPTMPGAMTALALARDSNGVPIPDAELADHVFSLMLAGTDPAAVSVTWALYWLCRESTVREKLLTELASAGNAINGRGLLDLPYLDAVFHETLRMYPIIPTPSGRKLSRPTRIGNRVYDKGTTLLPCTYLVHRREDLYPSSGQFLPERFLNRRFAPHEYFPFGGGARACMGQMLAAVEFKTAISTILSRWQIHSPNMGPLKVLRHGTLLAPCDEFRMIVCPIASPARTHGVAMPETAGKVEAQYPPQGKDACEDRNLVDIAVRRAREKGNQLAYTFLANGTEEAGSFTYAQLDVAAREIAAGLRSAAQPGDRALLVYETGLDFVSAFYACLYAGIIAVPVPAPETSRLAATCRRLKSVAEDCVPRLLLGTGRTLELLRQYDTHTGVGSQWMNTTQLAGGSTIKPVSVEGDTIAYLQYTSGSTASPRGVVVTHGNLVNHLAQIKEALEYDESSVSVCWMPHFHDYALVEGFLLPLFNGTPAYFMAPFAFLKRPASWLEAIGRYRATHSHSPAFGYRYCVRRVTEEQRARLQLSSWRSAGCGAEPIHPSTPHEFYSVFSPCALRQQTLRPGYGLAEATLMVTITRMSERASVGRFAATALAQGKAIPLTDGEGATQALVGCGPPAPATEVAIVDAASRRRLGTEQIGEIWVRSAGVAQGYWGRPQETEETFRASIVGENGFSFLRTGDMGFLHDGQLYVTSRMKDLIIVHGRNYHPQDIEWAVQRAHPALRQDHGAAFSIHVECEERLCIVQEIERRQYSDEEFEQIFSSVLQAVNDDCGVAPHAVVLIKWASLPRTSSGKVQRRRARQEYLSGSLKIIKSWSADGTSAPRSTSQVKPGATSLCHEAAAPPDDRSVHKADELLSWMRHYAETRINSRLIDERRCVPPYIILDFGNQGLFGLQAPTAYGGLELRHGDAVRVYEQLGAIDLTLATCVFLHNINGVLPILRFAPLALREEMLPRLTAGRELAAFALTEPEAGSNLGRLRARAVPDGDQGWRLYGVKRWNGSAWAGVISVFVRTPDHEGRMRGLSGFVIRQSQPGLRMGPEALTMGVRGIVQNALHLEGVQVSGKCMLGELGQGAQVVGHVLSHGRIATAAIAVGAMQRCAQLLLRYTTRREIATGLLLDSPQITVKVSEVVHRIAISRQLLSHCAVRLDRGDPVNPEIAMALKVCATDALNFAADLLVQLLGGRGYMENNLAPQVFRDARLLSIGEGANEALVAALGRGVRLTDSVYAYLGDVGGDGALAKQLVELRNLVERAGAPKSCAGTGVQAWRDFLLGRLTCALLDLGAAQTLVARTADHQPALRWARLRFEQQCHQAASGSCAEAALSVEQIHQEIDSYRSIIGDVEPLAPDVESSLDPLLRRDANGQHAEGGGHELVQAASPAPGGV